MRRPLLDVQLQIANPAFAPLFGHPKEREEAAGWEETDGFWAEAGATEGQRGRK